MRKKPFFSLKQNNLFVVLPSAGNEFQLRTRLEIQNYFRDDFFGDGSEIFWVILMYLGTKPQQQNQRTLC